MTLVVWIWGLALVICSIAFLVGVVGGVYLWRVRRTKATSSALISMVILATMIALSGTITALSRLLQFLNHP